MLRSLRASFFALTLVTLGVGCSRGGLGDDFDVDGDSGVDDDTAVDDTGAPIDTGDEPDTGIWWDTGGEPDTDVWSETSSDTDFWPDTPPGDTGIWWDTLPGDTDIWWDTPPGDTDIWWDTPEDTGIWWDTSEPDTIWPTDVFPETFIPDTFPEPDTGVFDTGFDAPVEGGILCGGSTCSAATQECCASSAGLACVSKGACMGGPTLNCSSAASCAGGRVCCFGGFGGTPTATCQPVCFGLQLCASDAECNSPQLCRPAFGGYSICR